MKKARNKSYNNDKSNNSLAIGNLKIKIKIGSGMIDVKKKSSINKKFVHTIIENSTLKDNGFKLLSDHKMTNLPSGQGTTNRPLRQKKQNLRYMNDSDEDSKKIVKISKVRSKDKSKNKLKKNQEISIVEKVKENSNKKKRNSERRKEKSRDAARCRRGKESEIFGELGDLLPLESPLIANLDKASVIRVATAFLRTRSLVAWGLDIPSEKVVPLAETPTQIAVNGEGVLEALDGFLMVLTPEGEVVYTSENISTFLGISQIDVMGHSLLDYTHPCDHDEVRQLASLGTEGPNNTFLRFKCTLTPKGRSVNLKSASYKVVQITGQVLNGKDTLPKTEGEIGVSSRGGNCWIVALGVPVPHPSNIEVPLDKQTFVSKHSLDMKFTYVDENVKDFCGYRTEDLLGRSLYQLNHALDTQLVREAYKTLRSKGQVETGRYRFLAHGGGYVWVVTQATLISGHRDSKPQYVVCLNFVISQVEFGDTIFSDCQLKASQTKNVLLNNRTPAPNFCSLATSPVPFSLPSVTLPRLPSSKLDASPLVSLPSKPSPVAATCSLLRDRTEDMNEGYLTFADNDSHVTILKEEPDDLTHLAPSVGEDCVPLEVPIFLPVFDDLLAPATHCYLSKPTDSVVNFGASIEDSIEFLLNEPNLISTFESSESHAKKRPRAYESCERSVYNQGIQQASAQPSLQLSADQFSSSSRQVPEGGVSSPHSSVVASLNRLGYDTPEPPFSPLLSQTASPYSSEKQKNAYCNDPRPVPATSKLFASLDDDVSSNSTMDLFNSFDLKLEDDLELRAPYIPPIDEVLAFDQEELFGMCSTNNNNNNNNESHTRRNHISCFGDKYVKEELPSGGSHILGSFSPQHSFQQSRNGVDTGGNFVDPNQVLPGQFYIKGEEKDNLQELRYLLEAPPPSPVKEPVDPPPPLMSSSSVPSIVFIKTGSKRPLSPSGFTITKRFRPGPGGFTLTNQRRDQIAGSGGGGVPSPSTNGKPGLPTPHAPLMQQLLNDSNSSSPLHPLNNLPLNKEGKIELTRQQLSDLLDRAGAYRSSYRVVHEGGSMPPTPPESFSPTSISPPTPATPVTDSSSLDKPLLMLDSTLSPIPSLFDLTSFDCEVNAPTSDSGLLHSSDLFMALEQTQ